MLIDTFLFLFFFKQFFEILNVFICPRVSYRNEMNKLLLIYSCTCVLQILELRSIDNVMIIVSRFPNFQFSENMVNYSLNFKN